MGDVIDLAAVAREQDWDLKDRQRDVLYAMVSESIGLRSAWRERYALAKAHIAAGHLIWLEENDRYLVAKNETEGKIAFFSKRDGADPADARAVIDKYAPKVIAPAPGNGNGFPGGRSRSL